MNRKRPALTGIYKTQPEASTAAVAAERPDRVGRVALPFWTTATAKRQLRMLAAEEDTTQQSLLTEALNRLFIERGKPPVA